MGEVEVLSNPKNCFDFEKKILKLFGMYPIQNDEIKGNKLLYYTKYLITFSISVSFFISIWCNIFFNLDDSSIVIESLYFGLTQTTFVSKLFNFHLRFATFKKLEVFLYTPIFNSYTEEQQIFIKVAVSNCQLFAKTFRAAVTVTIIFFFVFPFLDNGLLPLPSYFPMSVEKYRFILFVYQMIAIIMNGYCHSSLDCIFTTLISIGSAQFEILKDNLQTLGRGLDVKANRDSNDEIVLKRLSKDVFHHVTTIEYAYQLENVFSFVQFIQFLASSIIICVTGFQITVTPITDLKFVTLTLYFVCNLIQVLMCCWFGHDIMTKSEGVAQSCYMSDWYNFGPKVGKMLFIIMERSKRPITLTAGKFFDLTLQTLMQVLKTSYSYLALLRRMNEVREMQ